MNLSPDAPIIYVGTNHNDGEGKKFFSFVLDVLRPELAPHGIAVTTSILTNHAKGLLCWIDRTAAIVNIIDERSSKDRCQWAEGNHGMPVVTLTANFDDLQSDVSKIVEKVIDVVKNKRVLATA